MDILKMPLDSSDLYYFILSPFSEPVPLSPSGIPHPIQWGSLPQRSATFSENWWLSWFYEMVTFIISVLQALLAYEFLQSFFWFCVGSPHYCKGCVRVCVCGCICLRPEGQEDKSEMSFRAQTWVQTSVSFAFLICKNGDSMKYYE